MIYTESLPIAFSPKANPETIIQGAKYRFTMLTSRLIRMEYSLGGDFEDRPSQVFWYREQPKPKFSTSQKNKQLQIETPQLVLNYQPIEAKFSPESLQIRLKEPAALWHYGDVDAENLGGTARTLDMAHGAIQLEAGLISRSGWSVIDDTTRLVFNEHGWLIPRNTTPGYLDLYFFGYGRDYTTCLEDYCRIAGQVPLLPRWALGNWWSRYWEYNAKELLDLMRQFQQMLVPLSVCVVDMDWHITNTGNASSGWTGYTWNRELFPDPPGFLTALHTLGLKTALNLHPALGVYRHEEQYPQMAEAMGIDPASAEPIAFDITDPQFTRAYFEILHHPLESQGVDFWWLDWQQGSESKISGLDPLWWLNHLHFYDLGRDGEKRPFIFSRWGGLGNHRYPIGFSGDTIVSWESLAFQPYFTSTAANVAYGWWSHDIGGHMGGIEDAELYARWVQYGVFSPILRLHSTKNPFHERLPWEYDAETMRVARQALQLRHRFIPYLYSSAWQFHQNALAPIRPLYHNYPEHEEAYHCPNQYTFGSELLVAPFITPANAETRLSRQVVWLPAGNWFDFFNGLHYPGDGWHAVFGGLDDIPVFAKAGAIVPLQPQKGWDGVENPAALEVHVFPGENNRHELYEDDGQSATSLISFSLEWKTDRLNFEIAPARGDLVHLPTERAYTLIFHSLGDASTEVKKNGIQMSCPIAYEPGEAILKIGPITITPEDSLSVTIQATNDELLLLRDYRLPNCRQLLSACRLDSWLKQMLDQKLAQISEQPSLLGEMALILPPDFLRALLEITTGAGVHQYIHPGDGHLRVLMWNNLAMPEMRFRFAGLPVIAYRLQARSGPLPRFAVLAEDNGRLELVQPYGSGKVADLDQWLVRIGQIRNVDQLEGLDLTLQFDFTGEQPRRVFATLSQGDVEITQYAMTSPDLTVETGVQDWLALVNGEADPVEMFLSGKLLVSGDIDLLTLLTDLLNAGIDQVSFRPAHWKLVVNYMDYLTLEIGEGK